MKSLLKAIIKAIYSFLTNRLFLLLLIVLALFYILVTRIFELTIVQGDEYARAFELSIVREVDTEGQRGNIYDRNGYPLAENVIAYNVLLNDSFEVEDKNEMIYQLIAAIRKNGDEIILDFPLEMTKNGLKFMGSDNDILEFKKNIFNKRLISELSPEEVAMLPYEMFGYLRDDLFVIDKTIYPTEDILDILNIRYAQYIKRYSKYNPETIALNIKDETLALLEERRDIFPGVSIIESPYRVYHDAPYFAHIIGYTRKISADKLELMAPLGYESEDTVGVLGIEKEFEPYLRGYDGYQKVEVNNLGKTMLVLQEVQPIMGHDVYLTIDRNLQIESYHILEQQLAEIIVDKTFMRSPSDETISHILFKDIFDSIIKNKLIDASNFKDSASEYEARLYAEMIEKKASMGDVVAGEIIEKIPPKDYEKYGTIYRYLLECLKTDGLLINTYRSSEPYLEFKEGKMSFYDLVSGFNSNAMFVLPDGLNSADGSTVYNYISQYLIEDAMVRYDFDEHIYLYLIDEEDYNYVDLTMAVINQELVSASVDEISDLLRGRLSPIDFMKRKILAIEITPQALALDPSSGSVVISDTDTGEVLAMVSYPTYDNSRLVNQFDYDYYTTQLNDPTSPLYPRATYSKSAPGSTFKMVSSMAALEEEVVGRNEYFYATGYFDKITPAAKCWIYSRGGSHGSINLVGALEQSCNHFFYEMGYRLSRTAEGYYSDSTGISIIEDYTSRFGLDSKTGIEIGEAESTIATRDSVRAMIGQGTHGYTPVQLTRYINAIVNDGLLKELNIVDKVLDKQGVIISDFTPKVVRENSFDQENIDLVKTGMLAVTEGSRGSARSYFSDLPISVAGKTGTAELIKSRASHALFTGFAPYEDPEISVVTVIQFGYSSKYAALNTKKIIAMYFDLDKAQEGYTIGNILE